MNEAYIKRVMYSVLIVTVFAVFSALYTVSELSSDNMTVRIIADSVILYGVTRTMIRLCKHDTKHVSWKILYIAIGLTIMMHPLITDALFGTVAYIVVFAAICAMAYMIKDTLIKRVLDHFQK